MELHEFLSRLANVRPQGNGYMATCPAHEDSTPSLSIKAGDTQPIVLHCPAGCTTADVLKALNLTLKDICATTNVTRVTPPALAQDSRQPPAPPATNVTPAPPQYFDKNNITHRFIYQNADGSTAFVVSRDSHKKFNPSYVNNGQTVIGLPRELRVLYHLPAVLAASNVILVEGEKSCDATRQTLGNLPDYAVTAIAGGAMGPWVAGYTTALTGKTVIIIPDNDDPGRLFATRAYHALTGHAAHVTIVAIPALLPKQDIEDYLKAGHDRADLLRLIADAPAPPPPAAPTPLAQAPTTVTQPVQWGSLVDYDLPTPTARQLVKNSYSFGYFTTTPLPPYEWYVGNSIGRGSLNIIYGEAGSGKSWLAHTLAALLANGQGTWCNGNLLGARNVLWIDEEMGIAHLHERTRAISTGYHSTERASTTVWSMEGFKLSDVDWHNYLYDFVTRNGIEVVFIDPLIAVLPSIPGIENDNAAMRAALSPLRQLSEATGVTWIITHHAGKNGNYRGASDLRGVCDTMFEVAAGNTNGITVKMVKNRRGPLWQRTLTSEYVNDANYQAVSFKYIACNDSETAKKGDDAQEFIMDYLTPYTGGVPYTDIVAEALKAGYTKGTLNIAKNELARRKAITVTQAGGKGNPQILTLNAYA